MKRVTIRVPATTANLGPGFDAFGCALSLYTDVTFEQTEEGLRPSLSCPNHPKICLPYRRGGYCPPENNTNGRPIAAPTISNAMFCRERPVCRSGI